MRKLFLLCAACLIGISAMAETQTINAVKVTQGNTTDWYQLGDQKQIQVTIEGKSVTFPNKTYNVADGKVTTAFGTAPEDTWYTVRTDVTPGNWNTICVEKNITEIDGATFWNVVAERTDEVELEQVFDPQAGYGYIIRYTATELKVKYGDQVATEPVTATTAHPIQGNFAAITCDQDGNNELVDNYVVYQNQLHKVTGWVTMADHRAYVKAGLAPTQAPAPTGAPRMTMPKPSEVPTSLGGEADRRIGGKAMKVIENGQFRIVRDNKMYNAQGIEL